MTRPSHDELRGQVPLTPDDVIWITLCMAIGITVILLIGSYAIRADRPAACAGYPTYAECSASVAEGR